MSTELKGKFELRGLALPAATRSRLAWRPSALHAVESLLSGSGTPYRFSALHRVSRILEWHRRVASRFRPLLSWTDPLLGSNGAPIFGRRSQTAEIPPGPNLEVHQQRADASATVSAPAQRTSVSGPEKYPDSANEARMERSSAAIEPPDRAAASEPQAVDAGPYVRDLVLLKPVAAASERSWAARDSSFSLPSWLPLSSPAWRGLPEPSRPRIHLSVSSELRREVLLGSRPDSSMLVGTVIDEPLVPAEPAPAAAAAAEVSTPGWDEARRSIAAAVLRSGHAPAPLAAPPIAIQKPAEGARESSPGQGIEIRLVRPEVRDAGNERRTADAEEKAAANAPIPFLHSKPPEPQLDINAIADKVYQTLLRREQFERERKGLY